MNVRPTVERLSEPMRALVAAQPAAARLLQAGVALEEALASPDWAAGWLSAAPDADRRLLRLLLLKFAAAPFDPDRLERSAEREGEWTGAEIRVGLARLRRAGALFAVRKPWGERLHYLPADMIAVWQKLLLPIDDAPLGPEDERSVEPAGEAYRLPLSRELLLAWAAIDRAGLPFTAQGTPHKSAVSRLAAVMRLTPAELEPIAADAGGESFSGVPPQVALAIELGLRIGVLSRGEDGIAVDPAGLARWLARPEPDAELCREFALRYAASRPALHVAVCAVVSLPPGRWHADGRCAIAGCDPDATETALRLLAAFGWAERGTWRGAAVFRLTRLLAAAADGERSGRGPSAAGDAELYVQPDGEIVVMPDAGLAVRWQLERVADRRAADASFVYRLTKESCARAHRAGYGPADVAALLERGAAMPLPEPVRQSLADWFAGLGAPSPAAPGVAPQRGRRPGSAKQPAVAVGRRSAAHGRDRASSATGAAGGAPLTRYEPDRPPPPDEALFPGMADIPAAWLRERRLYHGSTRKELVRVAIGWRTALQVEADGRTAAFIPHKLEEGSDGWTVTGRWKPEPGGGGNPAAGADGRASLTPDRLGAARIIVPIAELFP